jgi:MFS family permease
MDIASDRAGTASGIMNGTAATATIISPVLAGYLIDQTGNWTLPFLISIGVLAFGVLMTFTMKPQNTFVAEEKQESKNFETLERKEAIAK